MAIFAKKEAENPQVNSSLLTAFTYLLQRMDRQFNEQTLAQNVADVQEGEDPWLVLTLVDPKLKIMETGGFGTWPNTKNAVIRFRIADEANPGAEIDHYCIVADAGDRQVIDSATGVIKNGSVYGQPLDWAAFIEGTQDVGDDPPKEKDPTRYYTVLKGGENVYQLSIKLGVNSTELIEHNGIENPDIPEGTELHLPTALPPKEVAARTVVELLERPKKMHVFKEEGTRKLAFGNAKNLSDISPTGPRYAKNTNVMILAVAHVPLIEDGQQVTAAYLMEGLALGDFARTGRVAWEIGFNHSHLEDGHVDIVKPKLEPRPEIQEKLDEMEKEQKAATVTAKKKELDQKIAQMEADQLAHPERYPDLFKTTYIPFEDGPVVYVADQDMIIHDLETKRPSRTLPRLKGVKITGTFEKKDDEGNVIVYGRPVRGENSWHWYGIPMDLITPEEDLFAITTQQAPLAARVANDGPFTLVERYVSIPLSKHLNSKLLKKHVEKLKTKI